MRHNKNVLSVFIIKKHSTSEQLLFFSVNLVIIGVIFALTAEKLGTKFLAHTGSSIALHGLNSVF